MLSIHFTTKNLLTDARMGSIIGNLVRVLVGFVSGFFASETDILEPSNGRPTWLILGFVFVGYLIFREFNK